MNDPSEKMRVLVIGGYGTFGGHLVRRLASQAGLELLVAGRSEEKARVFISGLNAVANLQSTRFDRDGAVDAQLQDIAPDIVVDASGPFQAYGNDRYRVAKSAIKVGAHYLDLADDSGFVAGIDALNEQAMQSRVFAISGASTSPALTSAVYRQLARHFTTVESFRGGIAPSPHAGVGISIVQAIAAYAGKAVSLTRDGKRTTGIAVCDTQDYSIAAPGALPLRRRRFSLVDIPDLALSESLDPQLRNTWFGAAPVPAVYHWLLRVLAAAVHSGLFRSLSSFVPVMHYVLSRWSFGAHRGGMFVELAGTDLSGHHVTCCWDLVAEGEDGPVIPTLAAEAIIRACASGRAPLPGARPATDELELEDFAALFASLRVSYGERSSSKTPPLVRRILGSRWLELPQALRDLHDVRESSDWSGQASVTRGSSPLARLIATIVGFPPAGSTMPVQVTLTRDDDKEVWKRNFDGHRFCSELTAGQMGAYANLFRERFGPVRIGMALVTDNGKLYLLPKCWQFFGIPMPDCLLPRGRMLEYVEDGRFRFHVEIGFPLIGHVVTYSGWLCANPA
ncbi:MAG: DUF4166 domain-containing protein [Gammaproteobacteria bacterium]|nr:DUF4166 domain-containing protein [Gammaproteobacteria bacterium]MDH4316639.1 DUF4166 domain-containing protein [Gammaproteobacteria bacterium]MDH5216009.1 DUF4166 domain-containing protein [Gammaproteobacteria bacterium]